MSDNRFTPDEPALDDAWNALLHAKPAVAEPDLDRIRNMIDEQNAKVVELPNRNWVKSAAVAAGVALLVGSGGGYQVAAMNFENTRVATSANDSGAATEALSNPGAGAGSAAAMGMGGTATNDKLSSSMPYFGGRPIFENTENLDGTAGTASSYVFSDAGLDRQELIAKLQEVFNIAGEVTGDEKTGLSVGDVTKYVDPSAGIGGSEYDKMVGWWFNDPSVAPSVCDADGKCTYLEGEAPAVDAAEAKAKEIFAALGLDIDSAKWSAQAADWMIAYNNDGQPVDDAKSKFVAVTANVFFDGIDAKQTWQIYLGPELVVASANGSFAKLVPGQEYEIVSAREAAERSSKIEWLNLGPIEIFPDGGGYPMPLAEDVAVAAGVSGTAKSAGASDKLDAGLSRVQVSTAELSTMTWWFADGTNALLPAYLITGVDEEGNERQWSQLAVADKYIDFN